MDTYRHQQCRHLPRQTPYRLAWGRNVHSHRLTSSATTVKRAESGCGWPTTARSSELPACQTQRTVQLKPGQVSK
jgi:hypothetical protein